MKKRALSMLLVLAMCLAALSGCGEEESSGRKRAKKAGSGKESPLVDRVPAADDPAPAPDWAPVSEDVFAPAKADAPTLYREANARTVASGCLRENIRMVTDMSFEENGRTQSESTLTLIDMDISGYPDDIRASGFMQVIGRGTEIACDVTYQDGVYHYNYTRPTKTTADVAMDWSSFDLDGITESMVISSKVNGDRLIFRLRGDSLTELGVTTMNNMDIDFSGMGVRDMTYTDADVTVYLDDASGTVRRLTMDFGASFTISGINVECTYQMDCGITPG